MQYLLDTNIVSRLMRLEGNVRSRIQALPATDRVIICTIVKGELLFGVERLVPSRRKQQLSTLIDAALQQIECILVPDSAADFYAAIKEVQRASGKVVEDNDLWIAATAMATGSVLVTHDTDMARVASLVREDWW